MKKRITAVLPLLAIVLSLLAPTFAGSRKSGANDLVALLPASDGIMIFDSKSFFSDALPRILAKNQSLLAQITAKIEATKTRTGIDLRDFDSVAVGATAKRLGDKKYDVDPVIIGRGQMTSASLLGAAKLAANGKYREEKVGNRVMYIFDAKKIAADHSADVFGDVTEIAMAALDDKTLAFGEITRVRQTLEARSHVSTELVSMLDRSTAAVAAFAIKPPAGLKSYMPLENDELGKNIDSIQYVYGSATVGVDSATVHMAARTEQNSQATSLYETLAGLQVLGKAFLGSAKSADKQVYSRMIENAKFAVKANEVTFDLAVPQSDIDILVGMIGK